MTDDREPFREEPSPTVRAIWAIKAQALREAAAQADRDLKPMTWGSWLMERAERVERGEAS